MRNAGRRETRRDSFSEMGRNKVRAVGQTARVEVQRWDVL